VHRASLGNLQEKFKSFPRTLPLRRSTNRSFCQADGPGELNMNLYANQLKSRSRVGRGSIACATLLLASLLIKPAVATPEDEVRSTFDHFVTAQNAHDIKGVESLLLGSPDFLWITRGAPVWGQDAALKRFAALYEGTWRLDPDLTSLKVVMVGDGVAQLYVPIMFTIGAAGQPPQPAKFLMNLVLVKTQSGWRVSSILPIPVPAASK
jgi:ketosteroid isomerase-like protein